MVDAKQIDINNRLRLSTCSVRFCSCFKPNCTCTIEVDACDTCGYSSREFNGVRGFGYGDPATPPPVRCMCNECDAACDANYGAKKKTGSRPVQMIVEATKHNTNYLLVPVNISREAAGRLHDRTDLQRYSALNELGEERNNLYWRDTAYDNNTSTAEHLTAFAKLVQAENDNYVQDMLDKYMPQRQKK
jgi:hypothetical protein